MKTVVSTLIAFVVLAAGLRAQDTGEFRLQIINNIADPAAGTFTVRVNGQSFQDNLGFRQASPLTTVNLPATLVISSTNEAYTNIVREFTVEQYDGGTMLLTLHGVADPTMFSTPDELRDIAYMAHEFALLPDAVQESRVNVTVLHSATDLPKMDLRVINDNPLVTDLDYGQTSFFTAAIPAKNYTLTMHPQGDFTTTWKTLAADFSQDIGKHIYIMPSGYLDPAANQNGAALELIGVYPDGSVITYQAAGEMETAKVQIINASADPVAESVDIYVNGSKAADNLGFRNATAYVDIPANENLSIVIAEPNSNAFDDKVLKTLELDEIDRNSLGLIILHGVVSPAGFAANPDGLPIDMKLFTAPDPLMMSSNPSTVEVVTFNAMTDSNPVDVLMRNEDVLASTLGYGSSTDGYFTVQPNNYTIDITPATANDVILKSFTADFTPLTGQAVILVAAGFLDPLQNNDGAPMSLFAVSTTGTITVLEPIPVSVSEEEQALRSSLAVAPNPTAETAFVSCELPATSRVMLSVHDAAGRVVKTIDRGTVPAGRISVPVATGDLAPGVYMLTLEAGSYRVTRSLNVVR